MLIAHSSGTMKQSKQLVLGVLLSLLAVVRTASGTNVTHSMLTQRKVIAGPKLGVYRGPSPYGPENLPAYQTWLGGQTLNYGLDFTADGSWSNIEGGSWLWDGWSPWVNGAPVGDRIWVISVPMCPDNVTSTLTTGRRVPTTATSRPWVIVWWPTTCQTASWELDGSLTLEQTSNGIQQLMQPCGPSSSNR